MNISGNNDSLLDLVGQVDLNDYIESNNREFEAKE